VYLDYLLKVYELVKARGKTMMFWGDIIKNHPELIPQIPDGVISLIWGYEKDHPFDKECEIFKNSGVPFYVCPGTSSWNAIIGRVDNMIGNVDKAVKNGLKHGSIGVLMTDWGDNGHWQHLPFSFLGIVHAAARSWNAEAEYDLAKSLSLHILHDETFNSGETMVNLGNAYQKTGIELFNSNVFGASLVWTDRVFERVEKLDKEKIEETKAFLKEELERFKKSNIKRKDSDLIIEEVINGVEMALFSLDLLLKIAGEKIDLRDRFEDLVEKFKYIWLERNREGGLKQSLEKLKKVEKYL
jgi:hexosaminidase